MPNKPRKTYDDYLYARCNGDMNEVWEALKDICVDYDGNTPFPEDIVYFFHEVACDVVEGKSPTHLKGTAKRGRKLSVLKAEQVAVLYAHACEVGIIEKEPYAANIIKIFKITERTWHTWRKKHHDTKETDPALFQPDLNKKTRAKWLHKS